MNHVEVASRLGQLAAQASKLSRIDNPSRWVMDRLLNETAGVVREYRKEHRPPMERPKTNPEEERMGREVLALMFQLTLRCPTCKIGKAVDVVGQNHGRAPYDWAGAEAERVGHSCQYTTWDQPRAA